MAEGGDSEGFASSTLDHNGTRHKDSYFPVSDASKSALRENKSYQGASLQEARLQFVAHHHDDRGICRNSRSHHSTQTMSSCSLIK